jgi:hypothetical protein
MQVIDLMRLFGCPEELFQRKNAFFRCFQGNAQGKICQKCIAGPEPREVSGGGRRARVDPGTSRRDTPEPAQGAAEGASAVRPSN